VTIPDNSMSNRARCLAAVACPVGEKRDIPWAYLGEGEPPAFSSLGTAEHPINQVLKFGLSSNAVAREVV